MPRVSSVTSLPTQPRPRKYYPPLLQTRKSMVTYTEMRLCRILSRIGMSKSEMFSHLKHHQVLTKQQCELLINNSWDDIMYKHYDLHYHIFKHLFHWSGEDILFQLQISQLNDPRQRVFAISDLLHKILQYLPKTDLEAMRLLSFTTNGALRKPKYASNILARSLFTSARRICSTLIPRDQLYAMSDTKRISIGVGLPSAVIWPRGTFIRFFEHLRAVEIRLIDGVSALAVRGLVRELCHGTNKITSLTIQYSFNRMLGGYKTLLNDLWFPRLTIMRQVGSRNCTGEYLKTIGSVEMLYLDQIHVSLGKIKRLVPKSVEWLLLGSVLDSEYDDKQYNDIRDYLGKLNIQVIMLDDYSNQNIFFINYMIALNPEYASINRDVIDKLVNDDPFEALIGKLQQYYDLAEDRLLDVEKVTIDCEYGRPDTGTVIKLLNLLIAKPPSLYIKIVFDATSWLTTRKERQLVENELNKSNIQYKMCDFVDCDGNNSGYDMIIIYGCCEVIFIAYEEVGQNHKKYRNVKYNKLLNKD